MTDHVRIFDTTLRDGEQSPGFSMNIDEKIRMASQLARLGVDVIEAGFPIASPGDFEAVRRIATEVRGPVIAGLARITEKDIDRAADAVEPAQRRRIHTFSSGSDIHLEHMMRISREENIRRSVKAVVHARSRVEDVEFSAQDTTRADRDYLVDLYTAVAEAGATTLNIPDTVGYTQPHEFEELIAYLVARVKVPGIVFSVHCHNDLGLAVANSLAAVRAGARQVECTINGIGERAGNCSLEEIAMALRVHAKSSGIDTGIVSTEIWNTSRLLTSITGVPVQPNKAIVGANAFAHESGIHQDGVLKARATYEIMTPESVGRSSHKMVLGKHSGKHALADRLSALGFEPTETQLNAIFDKFKVLADKKKEVFDEDLVALVSEETESVEVGDDWQLVSYSVVSGSQAAPEAEVVLRRDGQDPVAARASGDGPVDAVLAAIRELTGRTIDIDTYQLKAITGGTDAQGEVAVSARLGGRTLTGQGRSTDIIEASAKAYLALIRRAAANSMSNLVMRSEP
ncbi:MAG: 2-isopropylmalate synthase [Fibrobacteria bacterium]|nr:2-isopropylmalate synthase [Fibrobacteria bacterium]